jgi:hypothetical protein
MDRRTRTDHDADAPTTPLRGNADETRPVADRGGSRRHEPEAAPPRRAETRPEPARDAVARETVVGANGPAVTSLVTGLLSATFGFLVFTAAAAVIFGVIAIVTGIMGMKRAGALGGAHRGNAVTGVISGLLGLFLGVLVIVGGVTLFQEYAPELQRQLDRVT